MSRTQKVIKNIQALLGIAWREDKLLFAGYFITSLFGVALLFAVYFAYKLMIDSIFNSITLSAGSVFFVIIVTYLLFEYLSRFVYFTINQYYFDYMIRSKLQNVLTRRFMNKVASLDFAHLEEGKVRNLIAKVEQSYNWRLPEVVRVLNLIVYGLAALILSFAIALRFDLTFFLVLTVVSAPFYYLRAKYGNVSWSVYTSNAPKINYLWYLRNIFIDFETLAEIKIYALKEHFLKKTKAIQDELLAKYRVPIAKYSILSVASSTLVPVAIFFALNSFIDQVLQNRYTLGDFTFFLNTLFTFSGQISNILVNLGSIYENSLHVNDYFRLQSLENTIVNETNAIRFASVAPRLIEFRNVTFSYPTSKKPVLHNINLTIHKGEDVAIVGENGAGKTTIIKLLLRFYDPQEGQILVDGVDLRKIDIAHWHAHIGILFQDFAKYNFTLRENVEFGRVVEGNKRAVDEAIKQAQGSDLVKNLPKGRDQVLGRWFNEGQEISVGQWQKVAIARALYRQAPILILDEPTSNIDAKSEYKIFNNLMSVYKKKSIIFISHRFATVRRANHIYVVDDGRILEHGSHAELLKKDGVYTTNFNLQKSGYD